MTAYNAEKETLDSVLGERISLIQPKNGYRASVDPVLLAQFATASQGRTVDFGCGSGVIGLLLLYLGKTEFVTGIEIQQELADIADRNAKINELDDRMEVILGDIRDMDQSKLSSAEFSQVVCNPPFFAEGTGRLSPDEQIACARHEQNGTIEDFVALADRLLKPQGIFDIVFPVGRMAELIGLCKKNRLNPQRIRMVHPHIVEPATLVLLEAVKHGKSPLSVLPQLVIFDHNGSYTHEAALLQGYRRIDG